MAFILEYKCDIQSDFSPTPLEAVALILFQYLGNRVRVSRSLTQRILLQVKKSLFIPLEKILNTWRDTSSSKGMRFSKRTPFSKKQGLVF